jgi:hypothetical protein
MKARIKSLKDNQLLLVSPPIDGCEKIVNSSVGGCGLGRPVSHAADISSRRISFYGLTRRSFFGECSITNFRFCARCSLSVFHTCGSQEFIVLWEDFMDEFVIGDGRFSPER